MLSNVVLRERVTKPCIGDTNSRYNKGATYNLKDQNNFWKYLEGLYVQNVTFFKIDGRPITKWSNLLPAELEPHDLSTAKSFMLVSFDLKVHNDNLFTFHTVTFVSESSSNHVYLLEYNS